MKLRIEIELGNDAPRSVRTWEEAAKAVAETTGTLSGPEDIMSLGEKGFIFAENGCDVGQFVVVRYVAFEQLGMTYPFSAILPCRRNTSRRRINLTAVYGRVVIALAIAVLLWL